MLLNTAVQRFPARCRCSRKHETVTTQKHAFRRITWQPIAMLREREKEKAFHLREIQERLSGDFQKDVGGNLLLANSHFFLSRGVCHYSPGAEAPTPGCTGSRRGCAGALDSLASVTQRSGRHLEHSRQSHCDIPVMYWQLFIVTI